MRRRSLLASLAAGTSLLAGCSSRSEPTDRRTRTPEPTPPPEVTTVTEKEPLSDPSGVSDREAARTFVERHERRLVHNELVEGFATRQPAVEVSVDSPSVRVVHENETGYYLLSTCSGRAEYYDPDGSPSTAGRNAASVAHFVGGDTHRRIPFNAYRCHDGVVPTPTEGGSADETARFQIYDFSQPPNLDRTEREGHTVDVTVTHADGVTVLDRTYETELPLTVQPRVTDASGSYTVTATLDGENEVEYDWSLTTPVTSTWWALALVITADGELLARQFYPNGTVGLPDRTLCGGL